MSERTKIVETETSGEYGGQTVPHGKTSGGVYKPFLITDEGKIEINPSPPDVDAIADCVWDENITEHNTGSKCGKYCYEGGLYSKMGYTMLSSGTFGLNALKNKINVNEGKIDTVDEIVDAIKLKTDNLPSDPADASVIAGRFNTVDGYVNEVESLLKNANYGLSALGSEINTNEGKIDTIDTVVDAIKVITDKLYCKNDVIPYYKTYPIGANPVTVSSSANVWGYGNWTQVIAANAIANIFWVTGFLLTYDELHSPVGQLTIGTGAAASESEIFNFPYKYSNGSTPTFLVHQFINLPIPYKLSANTRVSVRVRDSEATAENYKIYLNVVTGGL